MENVRPEVVTLIAGSLCCVTPALIYIGAKIYNRFKPKMTWDITTITGLEEAGWKPGDIKKFLKDNDVEPAKPPPRFK